MRVPFLFLFSLSLFSTRPINNLAPSITAYQKHNRLSVALCKQQRKIERGKERKQKEKQEQGARGNCYLGLTVGRSSQAARSMHRRPVMSS